jgi:general secretion pathway protein A
MYEEFFGLREMPFSVMPDPRFAYRSLGHKVAEARMRFAADYKAGLAVLTGPVGCGKTTIANMLVADWADDGAKSVAYLPTADDRGRAAFLRRIMDGFGAQPERTFRNYADNRDALERFLLDEHNAGRHAVLVIDEAQKIHPDNFDTLTDLTNFQTATEKFVTVILFAQDNFANKLRAKDAFTSRIAFTGHLDPLSFDDMQGMIAHRLTVAGARVPTRPPKRGEVPDDPLPDLSAFLTDEAVVEVFKITKGVPRDVCIFLSALFLDGYVRDQKPVPIDLVHATLTEMSRMKKWPVQIKETTAK